jgi:DNA-binding LytR/AlgR family response regulator
MNCIIVDDEPLAREGLMLYVNNIKELHFSGAFGSADAAREFLSKNKVDLIFLDIQMPGTNGIEFARNIPPDTLVIFITAYAEYALDSYEVEAIDYLVKPVWLDRFEKAVQKALAYHQLLKAEPALASTATVENDYFFVKSDRKIFKIHFKDIWFIEGLKDYVVLHAAGQKIITAMNIKTIHEQLPVNNFVRIHKSYLINVGQISSFDNNTIFINNHEIPIGNAYRDFFFEEYVTKRMLCR